MPYWTRIWNEGLEDIYRISGIRSKQKSNNNLKKNKLIFQMRSKIKYYNNKNLAIINQKKSSTKQI